MKKFIITGGAGFIGSTLVKALLEKGAESILIIDDLSTGSESNISSVLDLMTVRNISVMPSITSVATEVSME